MKLILSRWRPLIATLGFAMVLFIGVFLVIGQTPAEEWKAPARAARKKNPIPADEQSVAAGKIVYAKECLSCHGTTGKGDGPASKALEKNPGDLSKASMWEQTDGALFWKLTEGRKPMPSFEKNLSEEQRWQVINYTRTLAPKPAGQPETK